MSGTVVLRTVFRHLKELRQLNMQMQGADLKRSVRILRRMRLVYIARWMKSDHTRSKACALRC